MKGSFTIGRIAGIRIEVHYTWLFIFLLVAWSLAGGLFPDYFPGWAVSTYWIVGVISALLLFVSVLIHELCHSLVAIQRGLKVQSIMLFIFGGVSNLEGEPEKASVEFIMSIVGPLSSLALGGIFYGIRYALASSGDNNSPIFAIVYYMAFINILLAIFNILPGFPLDGGRVLRSIIWGITGSLRTATVIAGNVGRIFGWALIALGAALIFGVGFQVYSLVFQGFVSGIWLIFIGWFLVSAASSAMRDTGLRRELAGVKVKDVMDPMPECISPATSIERAVNESFIQRGRRALPICYDSRLVGIVTLADVKRVPQDRWANTPVQEVMTRSPLLAVNESDDLNNVLALLGARGLNQVPVMSNGRLVGLLSRSDISRYLQTRKELGIRPERNLNR